MHSSRLIAGFVGAAALFGTAFSVAPAAAAPASAGAVQTAQADGGLVQKAWHHGRPHHYGPRRFYGRPVYRPRCFMTDRRVWNGYRWAIRPVRVCR